MGETTPMQDIISALSTGFTQISTNAQSMLTTILPIVLGLIGAILVVRWGISWFKSLGGKNKG